MTQDALTGEFSLFDKGGVILPEYRERIHNRLRDVINENYRGYSGLIKCILGNDYYEALRNQVGGDIVKFYLREADIMLDNDEYVRNLLSTFDSIGAVLNFMAISYRQITPGKENPYMGDIMIDVIQNRPWTSIKGKERKKERLSWLTQTTKESLQKTYDKMFDSNIMIENWRHKSKLKRKTNYSFQLKSTAHHLSPLNLAFGYANNNSENHSL